MSDGSRPDRDAAIKLARDSLALIFWHFVLEKVDCDDDDDDDDDDNDDETDVLSWRLEEESIFFLSVDDVVTSFPDGHDVENAVE